MTNTTNQGQPGTSGGGVYGGVAFESIAISPANADTPLQCVCVFDWRKNTAMTGGLGELNERLGGLLETVRKEGHVRGEELDTLLLTPPAGLIKAQSVLILGLGDPQTLSKERLIRVGRMALLEAARMGVVAFSFAPSIRDAGVTSFPAADVSVSVANGMIQGLRSLQRMRELGLDQTAKLQRITFLAGREHLENSRKGIQQALRSEASAP